MTSNRTWWKRGASARRFQRVRDHKPRRSKTSVQRALGQWRSENDASPADTHSPRQSRTIFSPELAESAPCVLPGHSTAASEGNGDEAVETLFALRNNGSKASRARVWHSSLSATIAASSSAEQAAASPEEKLDTKAIERFSPRSLHAERPLSSPITPVALARSALPEQPRAEPKHNESEPSGSAVRSLDVIQRLPPTLPERLTVLTETVNPIVLEGGRTPQSHSRALSRRGRGSASEGHSGGDAEATDADRHVAELFAL